MIGAITLPDSVVEFNWGGITQCLLPGLKQLLPVIRMDNGHPAVASVLLGSLAGHFLPAVCFAENITVGRGPPDPCAHSGRERPVSFFAGAKGTEGFVTHLSRSQLCSNACQQLAL